MNAFTSIKAQAQGMGGWVGGLEPAVSQTRHPPRDAVSPLCLPQVSSPSVTPRLSAWD